MIISSSRKMANAHCGGQPYRVRIAPQTGFLRSTWRATGGSGSQTREEKLRVARRCEVLGPRRSLWPVQEWRGKARRGSPRGVESEIRGVQEAVSPARRSTEPHAERAITGWLGQGFARLLG